MLMYRKDIKSAKEPRLTIITVVKNSPGLLLNTINSVKEQSFDNFEYIVIDGASDDETISVIKNNSDVVSKWISEEDFGIYFAMNKGIALASGEWITFLNAGDVYHDKDTLKKIYMDFYEEGSDVIYGASSLTYPTKFLTLDAKKLTYINLIIWQTRVVCHQALFVSRKIAKNYDTTYKLKAELNWYFDLVESARNIKKLDFIIVNYDLGGISETNFKDEIRESLILIFRKSKYLFVLCLPVIFYKIVKRII